MVQQVLPPNNNFPPPVYPPGYGQGAFNPYQQPAQRKPQRSGCWTCALVFVIGIVVLVGLGVGGYVLISNGTINQRTLMGVVGKAPGEVSVANLGDADLNVEVTSLDTENSSASILDRSRRLAPFDMTSIALEPGRYRLDLTFSGKASVSCTIKIQSNDLYQFAATGKAILVANERIPVSKGADLKVPGSALCQQ